MLTAHWLGALAAAGLTLGLNHLPRWREADAARPEERRLDRPVSLLAALPDSLRQTGPALLSVCGAMMLFSILAALFRQGLRPCCRAGRQAMPELPAISLGRSGGGRRGSRPAGRFRRARPAPAVRPVQLRRAEHPDAEPAVSGQKRPRPGRLLACRLLHGAAAYGICGLLVRLLIYLNTRTC